jgi:hypothetical protein
LLHYYCTTALSHHNQQQELYGTVEKTMEGKTRTKFTSEINLSSGGPLTKQYSASLYQPTLLDYHTTLSSVETGWLELSVNNKHSWGRRYFELKDGVIRHAISDLPQDYESSTFIPIENIIKLVTSVCTLEKY